MNKKFLIKLLFIFIISGMLYIGTNAMINDYMKVDSRLQAGVVYYTFESSDKLFNEITNIASNDSTIRLLKYHRYSRFHYHPNDTNTYYFEVEVGKAKNRFNFIFYTDTHFNFTQIYLKSVNNNDPYDIKSSELRKLKRSFDRDFLDKLNLESSVHYSPIIFSPFAVLDAELRNPHKKEHPGDSIMVIDN